MRVWVLALMLVVPMAQAGTEASPEISDSSSDSSHSSGARDVVAVWIEDELVDLGGEPSLHIRVRVADDHDHEAQFHAHQIRYRIGFVPSEGLPSGAVESYVYMRPGLEGTNAVIISLPVGGGETNNCKFGVAEEVGGVQDIDEEIDVGASFDEPTLFGCILPLSVLGASASVEINDLYIDVQRVVRGPTSGGLTAGTVPADKIPPTVVESYDRAPDTGFGTPWPPAEPEPEPEPVVNETANETAPQNQTAQPQEPSEPANGTTEPTPAMPVDEEPQAGPTPDGNTTEETPRDEESPGLPLVALLAGLGLAARIRNASSSRLQAIKGSKRK